MAWRAVLEVVEIEEVRSLEEDLNALARWIEEEGAWWLGAGYYGAGPKYASQAERVRLMAERARKQENP